MNNGMAALGNLNSYDPLDRLAASRSGAQRFYRGQRFISERHDNAGWSLIEAAGRLIGQRSHDGHLTHALFATDGSESVLAVADESGLAASAYSPYGERAAPAADRYPGFNGQRSEAQTGWYLLGNGYRAFNPAFRRFHSPDNFSPFGGGGLNPYVYCLGDPINFTDPTGHLSSEGWASIGVGLAFAALGIAITALSGGSATGAYTASVSSVISITAGLGSAGVGAAAVVLGESSDQQGAAQVLGWISMGLGILSAHQAWAARPAAQNAGATVSNMPGPSVQKIAGSSFAERAAHFDSLQGKALKAAVKYTRGRVLHELADSSVVRAEKMFPHLKDIKKSLKVPAGSTPDEWVRTNATALNMAKKIGFGTHPGVMQFQLWEAGIRSSTLPVRVPGDTRVWYGRAHFEHYVTRHIDELFRTRDSYLF